jgi:hypothetical protein
MWQQDRQQTSCMSRTATAWQRMINLVLVFSCRLLRSFYIILRGAVSVLIGTVENASDDGNGENKSLSEGRNDSESGNTGDVHLGGGQLLAPLRYDDNGKLDRSQLGRTVATFGTLLLTAVSAITQLGRRD